MDKFNGVTVTLAVGPAVLLSSKNGLDAGQRNGGLLESQELVCSRKILKNFQKRY